MEAVGSISIALRLVKPFTLVASLPNFCEKASERLWAGSVDLGCRCEWMEGVRCAGQT